MCIQHTEESQSIATLNEIHVYFTSYCTPLDLYYLRSPIENVWERLAVTVFVVMLLRERDSPKSFHHAEYLGGLGYPVQQN